MDLQTTTGKAHNSSKTMPIQPLAPKTPKPMQIAGVKTLWSKKCPAGCFNTFCQSEQLNFCFPGPITYKTKLSRKNID